MTPISRRKHRIFLGIGEVAGYYTNLKKGFDEIGVKSYFFSIDGHPFDYGTGKKQNPFMRFLKFLLSRKMSSKRRKSLSEIWWTLLLVAILFPVRLSLLVWSLFWCDVFVFHGTSSFFHGTSSFFEMYDLPILKLFRKRIVWVFHGSDTRPSYLSGSSISMDYGCSIEKTVRIAKKQKRWVRRIERYADIIISHPPSSHFNEKRFVRYLSVGNPFHCEYNIDSEKDTAENNGKLRIVHAPSFSEFKGSGIFRDIIRRMKSKGYSLEFVEIIGKPNSVVLKELADCDFVIDQLYSDTVMAGLSTEASFFGKPAAVGGYASLDDMGILAGAPAPPTEYQHPDDIESAIEKLITNRDYRIELGEKAQRFVLEQWAPAAVAQRFLRVINDDCPEEWLYDPQDIRYRNGCGISEQNAKALLGEFLEHAGKEGLCLPDKPELENRIIEFSDPVTSE
ncbi:MAG: hypothetical protein ABFR50_05125 [Candidatus Fermentibacteria bacterium]